MNRSNCIFALMIGALALIGALSHLLADLHPIVNAALENSFSILLVLVVLAIAGSAGAKCVLWLTGSQNPVEADTLHYYVIGIGGLGTVMFLLGAAGCFSATALALVCVAASFVGRQYLTQGLAYLKLPGALFRLWQRSTIGLKAIFLVFYLIFLIALIEALVPPWSYDSLMYHLQAPRLFLQEGQIRALPELWQANGPMILQMLYAIGLAAGTDVFPGLLHLSTGVMLSIGTFLIARRLDGEGAGWLATALLLGVPALPLWSSFANVDVAWALFGLLMFDALLRWREDRARGWLKIAGLMLGFALASKYLALGLLAAVAAAFLLWLREDGVNRLMRSAAVLLSAVLLAASPWYLRNWIELGNPVFPFYFVGGGWSQARVDQLLSYMHGFGRGASARGLLAFLDVFFKPEAFRTIGLERLNPLLLLSLLALIPPFRKPKKLLCILILVQLSTWWLGSQQIRFLLPVIPLVSILAALAFHDVAGRVTGSVTVQGLVLAAAALFAGATLFGNLAVVYQLRFLPVIAGLESRDAFLDRVVYDYRAMQTALDSLAPEDRMLMLWDGQSYYCDARCIPDADQAAWLNLTSIHGDYSAIAAALREQGISLLFVGKGDAEWMIAHDPTGVQAAAYHGFMAAFSQEYTRPVFEDDHILVLRMLEME
ncbi:MAG: glycosyltransferase family 39 protein [Anaerolineales bacterium]|nr:glycosyltransferase family 39 protein [Anaerolineales bacterium]